MKIKNNTTVEHDNFTGYTLVKFYNTVIVKFSSNLIHLNHGSFVTNATVKRMNEISELYNLKYSVRIKNDVMLVTHNGIELPFCDDNRIVLIQP